MSFLFFISTLLVFYWLKTGFYRYLLARKTQKVCINKASIENWLFICVTIWQYMPYMKAKEIISRKFEFDDGSIQEIVIWEVPKPVLGSKHSYKYSLYFGRHGQRLVGYDNERGKGDHKHIKGVELPYQFQGVKQLVSDFLNDMEKVKNEEKDISG